MKKTYNAPYLTITEVKTVLMTNSVGLSDEEASDLGTARSRRHNVQWIDDEDDLDIN